MKKSLLIAGVLVSAAAANAQVSIMASSTAFVDITATGTSAGTSGDDVELNINTPWGGNGLVAGGVTVRVGNNGGILWGNSAGDLFTNATDVGAINSTTFMTMVGGNSNFGTPTGNGGLGPRQFFAVHWDDLFPSTGTAATSILWQVIGSDLIIQWNSEDHFNAQGTGNIQFQAQFHGGVSIASGLSLVDYVYNDTVFQPQQYQNDGGSATIGYKNWGINALANDVEWGLGGGNDSLSDPAFGGANMQPKVSGWAVGENPGLTHAVKIVGPVPEPATMTALGLGVLALIRKRRAK